MLIILKMTQLAVVEEEEEEEDFDAIGVDNVSRLNAYDAGDSGNITRDEFLVEDAKRVRPNKPLEMA